MRRCYSVFVFWLFVCGYACAADLEKIDRQIRKLPAFTAQSQAYCLLVFGPEANTRIWLVRDGDTLYVDRNGNGDLTEADERVAANPKNSQPEDGNLEFLAGHIAAGERLHMDLRVGWFSVDHLRDTDDNVRKSLEQDPKFRGCSIWIDMDMPGHEGVGLGGRVPQLASVRDNRGLLQFAARPADAPVLHFGGPLEVTLADREGPWRINRPREVYLVVGTPGFGPGTTANVAYEKLLPTALAPTLEVSFPPASPGEPAVVKTYEMPRRCCTVNLYGDVAVPTGVGVGRAHVEVSLASWPGLPIASTHHEVDVVAAKPGPTFDPVSPRLFTKLAHEQPSEIIGGVRFSPDGKRLLAGSYPGGIVNIWEVAGGKRLASLNAGSGGRATLEYFIPSPDWRTIFTWQERRGKFEKFERDGKVLNRVEYDDKIQSWNANSGEELRAFQQTPPHGIRMMFLAPSGNYFLTQNEPPGEYETSQSQVLTLWDTASGEHRIVEKGYAYAGAFSSDSRLVAVRIPRPNDETQTESIRIVQAPEWKEVGRISVNENRIVDVQPALFIDGGKTLVGTERVYDRPNDWRHFQAALKFWDVATGAEVFSAVWKERDESIAYVTVSPDGQTVVATTYTVANGTPARLIVVDVAKKSWNAVDLGPVYLSQPIFHPGGQWLAVTASPIMTIAEIRTATIDDAPQTRIELIDLATRERLETAFAPQGAGQSTFSPDGKILATGGKGGVLLWDFRTPPKGNTQR